MDLGYEVILGKSKNGPKGKPKRNGGLVILTSYSSREGCSLQFDGHWHMDDLP